MEKRVCISTFLIYERELIYHADSPPDHVEDLYEDLENTSELGPILARLTPEESGWLARYVRAKIEKDREQAGEEIEQELKVICRLS